MMITGLQLRDFKAFKSLDIELRPLTILLGPNNTGKSSVLAPIRLLAQTIGATDRSIALLLDGQYGDFGTFKDIVHGNRASARFQITLSGENKDLPFHSRKESEPLSWTLRTEFGYRSRRRQLVLNEVEMSDQQGHVLTASYVPESDRHVVTRINDRDVPASSRAKTAKILGLFHFVPFFTYAGDVNYSQILGGSVTEEEFSAIDDRVDDISWGVRHSLGSIEYIGSMRAPPERTYHQTGEGRSRIGATGENWAGMLVLDSSRAGKGSRRLVSSLNSWLKGAGLASEVKVNWLSDRHYEIQIRHPVTREAENLADVGQGNSQVIPVILGGLRLQEGALYLVEEPEIHLHPRAQAELGDYFASLRQTGIHALIETHSEYLVLRVQQRVAAGEIPPKDVAFYYTHATSKGRKTIRKLTLDSEARFQQSLPNGFFPERLEEARKLARLRA